MQLFTFLPHKRKQLHVNYYRARRHIRPCAEAPHMVPNIIHNRVAERPHAYVRFGFMQPFSKQPSRQRFLTAKPQIKGLRGQGVLDHAGIICINPKRMWLRVAAFRVNGLAGHDLDSRRHARPARPGHLVHAPRSWRRSAPRGALEYRPRNGTLGTWCRRGQSQSEAVRRDSRKRRV